MNAADELPEIWTQEQADALNEFQASNFVHPFTCGGERCDAAHRAYAEKHGGDFGQLVATRRGWHCPVCGYRQFWAHAVMFAGAPPPPWGFDGAPKPDTPGEDEPL